MFFDPKRIVIEMHMDLAVRSGIYVLGKMVGKGRADRLDRRVRRRLKLPYPSPISAIKEEKNGR